VRPIKSFILNPPFDHGRAALSPSCRTSSPGQFKPRFGVIGAMGRI
jgi:hypothetical protein